MGRDSTFPGQPKQPDFLDFAMGGYGVQRDAATADAFRRVGALLGAGKTRDALAMLEYAQRLAPADDGITLAIGLVRLKLGDPGAAAPLEMLTARTDWRDVWMALVRVRMRFGDDAQGAADLHTALSRTSPPTRPTDIRLADTVSERAAAPGWCALDNDGRITIASARNLAVGLSILLDGGKVTGERKRRAQGGCEVRLPAGWERAGHVEVLLRGHRLIGSPIDVARVTRVEGFVEAVPATGALRGWCWFPAERERIPEITLASLAEPARSLSVHAQAIDPVARPNEAFGLPFGFVVEADMAAPLGEALAVTGPHGKALYGSPVWRPEPRAAVLAVARRFPLSGKPGSGDPSYTPRELPVPVATVVPRREAKASVIAARSVDVVIPVHGDRDGTLACIASVRSQIATGERIIVVSDASPDPGLLAALSALARDGAIVLQIETVNRGFPGAANIGLRRCAGNDVVLLNSDTIVTPGWLAGLRAAAYSAADIGTATPLSNDATIFSYPRSDGRNATVDPDGASAIAALAAAANHGATVEVPTGHGFCMFIRAECLAETGRLREDLFAQGYGEENDFCMRARHLGWRHVAAPGVFVAHRGSRSFSAARDDLRRRNAAILNRLHPGYDALIQDWERRDPLGESRRRIDMMRLRETCDRRDVTLLITHDREGGVRRHVAQRAAEIVRSGRVALVLRPENAKHGNGRIAGHAVVLDTGADDSHPNLRFRLPDERKPLGDLLAGLPIRQIELDSLIGHADALADLVLAQGVPFDVVIHDYSWYCPRITLTTGGHRYCGEPDIAGCRDCVEAHGDRFDDDVSPDMLVARSQRLMQAARSVIAPSEDAARRIGGRFGVAVSVQAWEATGQLDLRPVSAAAGRTRPVRVCITGAIGDDKGYATLLKCALAAAEKALPIEFVVVGFTRDDARLLDTGVVRITGRYDEAEAVALIGAQKADFGWLPSVWPETWSYVLTRMWQAGLHVVVHDIGAPAHRVRAQGGGFVAPLHLPPERLLGLFLDPSLFRAPAKGSPIVQPVKVATVTTEAALSAPSGRGSGVYGTRARRAG